MKRLPSFTVMFSLGVVLLCSACGPRYSGKKQPIAKNGELDLRGWNFTQDGPIDLIGEWEFYWKQLYDGTEQGLGTTIKPDAMFPVPRNWKNFKMRDGTSVEGRGYATYRLRVLMPSNERNKSLEEGLRVYLTAVGTAYSLQVLNSQRSPLSSRIQGGVVGKDAFQSKGLLRPDSTLTQWSSEWVVILQVSNFEYRYGGALNAPRIHWEKPLLRALNQHDWINFLSFGVLLMMGLYHLALYFMRPKDRFALWFSLFCFEILIYGFFSYNYPARIWPDHDGGSFYLKTRTFILYLSTPTFLLFLQAFFPRSVRGWSFRILTGTGLVLALIVIATEPLIFLRTLDFFYLYYISWQIWVFRILGKVIIRERNRLAWLVLFGFLFIAVTAINEILRVVGVIQSVPMNQYGLSFFIFFQSLVMAVRNQRAHTLAEKLAEEMIEKNSELQRMDRLKDEFIANTSHELRTPLNGIIGLAESMIDGVAGKLSKTADQNLEMIAQSGKRLTNLVNDILDFSKMKNRELRLRKKPVDVKSTAEVVLALSQPLLRYKPVQFVNRLPKDLPLVDADEDRLQQIVLNLVGNAVKFTHEGEITLSARKENGRVKVSVQDTGIGISQEKQTRVFDSFEQADGSTAREYGGTGLGLSVTKKLVELHGGEIHVTSVRGMGSTFTFTLPVAQDQTQIERVEASDRAIRIQEKVIHPLTLESLEDDQSLPESPTVEGAKRRRLGPDEAFKILVVDDEPVNVQVLKNQLQSRNYHVLTAQDGFEALDVLRREKDQDTFPDLMLLDLMMPRMNGYEVSRAVRETHDASVLPIVMLTAKNQVSDLVEGLRSGANDYLTKPFAKEELLARVESQLKLKDATEALKAAERAEMELLTAQTVQKLLIPKEDPQLEEIEIASFYQPASETGGDWYDYRHRPELNTLEVLIGDVTGHGVPAAIITGITDSVYSTIHQQSLLSEGMGRSDAHVLHPNYYMEVLNEVLYQTIKGEYTVTLYCSVIDLSKKEMLYASASHKHCYIWREEGFPTKKGSKTIRNLSIRSRSVGQAPGTVYKFEKQTLQKDDVILWYTDGLTENKDAQGEMFRHRAVKEILERSAGLTAEAIKDRLVEAAYRHYGEHPRDDDVTLVVGRVR